MIITFEEFEYKYDKFQPLNTWEKIYNFYKDEEFKHLFYNYDVPEKDINKFKTFLNINKEHYALMYHGTDSKIPIMDEGLKKTSLKTKKSYQSEVGYVYLSVFPEMAKKFGKMAYPDAKNIQVYQVFVKIKDMKPDKDQLRNKRIFSNMSVGDSLAESLIYGHGCRIASNIEPYKIKKFD